MRISNVTKLSHLKKVEFGYLTRSRKNSRQSTEEKVRQNDEEEARQNIASELNKLKFEKSMQDRIVRKEFTLKEKNCDSPEKTTEMTKFVQFLCFGSLTTRENLPCPYIEMLNALRGKFYQNDSCSEESKKRIRLSLTNYGVRLRDADGMYIEELVIRLIENSEINDEMTLRKTCEKMIAAIKAEIEKKKKQLAKSLLNNKIPYRVKNGQLVPQSNRIKWLMSFIVINNPNNSIDNLKFKKLAALFSFDKLELLFSEQSEIKSNTQIKKLLQTHCKDNWKKIKDRLDDEEKKDFSFYANEVTTYFNHYFPLNGKRKDIQHSQASGNQKVFVNAKNYYLKAETIERTVQKQILNQITNAIITQGKLIDYFYTFSTGKWDNTAFTSETFEEIRINEAFKKQVLQTVLFALNRLKYFLGDNINDDISGSQNFNRYFAGINEDVSLGRIRQFFNYQDGQVLDKAILEEIYSSINNLRLNTYHFKKGNGLESLKKAGDYPLSAAFLQRDLELVEERFAQKLITMNIPIYYRMETIQKLLQKCTFSFKNLITNLRPSFNKVYEKGSGLYNADENKIYTCDWFVKFDNDKDRQLVYKNVLQLLYNNVFIPQIASNPFNKKFFKIACINNQKVAQINSKQKKAYKYKEIEDAIKDNFSNENANTLLSKLQSYIMKEETLLRSDESQENKKERNPDLSNKFVEYIQDVFALAFNDFLEQNFADLKKALLNPVKRAETKISYDDKENLKSSIHLDLSKFDNFEYPNFYSFVRILSRRELNELKNQFTKYVAYLDQSYVSNKDKTQIDQFAMIIELMDIVSLTEPPNAANDFEYVEKPDEISLKDARLRNEINKLSKLYEDHYCRFIEGGFENIDEYVDLYAQPSPENLSDNYQPTLIPQRGLAAVSRLGTLDYYEKVLAKPEFYFVTKKDYEIYKRYRDSSEIIEELHKTRADKHKSLIEWNKSPSQKLSDAESHSINIDISEYRKAVEEISQYDQLKNKLTFSDLNKINAIHMSLLSRLVGFANDWEKDMLFILKYFQYKNCFSESLCNDYLTKQNKSMKFYRLKTLNQEDKDGIKRKLFGYFKENQAWCDAINAVFSGTLSQQEHNQYYCEIKTINNNMSKFYYVDQLFNNGDVLGNVKNFLKLANHSDFAKDIFLPLMHMTDIKCFEKAHVRNQLAHFEQINSKTVSIMELINGLRYILAYDRKKKNAITKAIIDLLAKENIILELKKDGGIFKIKSVKSGKIAHLKKFPDKLPKVEVDYYSPKFVSMIEEIMNNKQP